MPKNLCAVTDENSFVSQELQEDKNTRTQESCLVKHFLSRQPRFCLQEPCQKVKNCFFREESCIEEMEKRILTDKQESGKNDVKIVD